MIGSAYVDIEAKTDGFGPQAEKGILGAVGGIATKAAGLFAAGFAVKQGADFFGGLIKDASESRRVLAETEQAIKATGGAAGVSAKQVADLAESLSKKTGIDDELIQTGSNLLLTFKSIRDEVGAGNDIFTQANSAVLDLSKQFGGVEASAVQVGKALNDPIAGVTALTRVGIQFSDKQKDTIKSLVETGDVLGAQKIILGEIAGQVGGQAEAQATAADKLKVAWGNLREELGARLLPIVDKVATFLADRLPGALTTVGTTLGPIIAQVQAFIKTLTTGFTEDEGTGVERFALILRDTVFPIIVQVAAFVQDNLKPILIGLGVTFVALTAPITGVVAAILIAYARFEGFRNVVNAVVEFLVGTVIPAIAAVASGIADKFGELADWVRTHWAAIQEAIGHVIVVVQAIIEAFVIAVQALWQMFGDEILNVARIVWDQIQNVVDTAVSIISNLIEAGLALINGDWGQAWDAIKDILAAAWEYIRETIVNALRLAREAVEAGVSAIVALVGDVPGQILGALRDLPGQLRDVGINMMEGLIGGITSMAKRVADAAWDTVKGAVKSAWDAIVPGSPSRIGTAIGINFGEGIEAGINRMGRRVERSSADLLAGAISSASGLAARPSLAGSGGGSTSLTITGPLVNIGSVLPGQEGAIGSAVKQAVVELVRNGTVGQEMKRRQQVIAR